MRITRRSFINGQEVHIPVDENGMVSASRLREVAGVDGSRDLIRMSKDGQNIVINPDEEVFINAGDYFADMPRNIRG